ncbi:MAG TPA: hypothetical protein VIM62_13610, partial [Acidobacteriaceae bacterium]
LPPFTLRRLRKNSARQPNFFKEERFSRTKSRSSGISLPNPLKRKWQGFPWTYRASFAIGVLDVAVKEQAPRR